MGDKYQSFSNEKLSDILMQTLQTIFYTDRERLKYNQVITEENVFQKAVKHNRDKLMTLAEHCLLPGSTILNLDHWNTFYQNFQHGKSSLILAEHKSNLDVVMFFYLMKQAKKIEDFEDIVFIAGRKLNEESMVVRTFAEMFNRLIVVPKSETQEATEKERESIYKINYSAQHFLKSNLNKYIYLIYPTGTRSRIWEPESYNAITETVNYLKKFEQVIFMSCDGNCMFPLPAAAMDDEPLHQSEIKIRFSEPMVVREYVGKQKELFLHQFPEGNTQELKSFITKSITENIYKLKPVPPMEEGWNDIVRDSLQKTKD